MSITKPNCNASLFDNWGQITTLAFCILFPAQYIISMCVLDDAIYSVIKWYHPVVLVQWNLLFPPNWTHGLAQGSYAELFLMQV